MTVFLPYKPQTKAGCRLPWYTLWIPRPVETKGLLDIGFNSAREIPDHGHFAVHRGVPAADSAAS